MAGSLPPSTLLKARLVCRHWRHCLAATVEALYIVPEFFVNEALTQQLPLAYPKATTVAIDLQDTFMAVPEEPAQGGGPDSDGAAGGQAGAPQQPALVAHPIAALAAAFAAGFANANQAAQAVAAAQAAVAAQVQLHQGQGAIIPPPPPPPPTVTKSVVPTTPVPGVLVPGCRHLRLRLPDQTDVEATAADVNASWQYVSNLLSMEGSRLQSLSLSIAPGPASITVLSALTHLTALTMDEASHLAWGNEHIPTVGLLSNLRSLTIKIPPFRTRPEQPTNGVAPNPGLLASWGQLTQLTRLHVCAMRYSYHASLVAVLPAFKRLESLALRAPQTRLPWPGTDRPVFNHIGMLTGLTQLSLALADHIMAPQNWQARLLVCWGGVAAWTGGTAAAQPAWWGVGGQRCKRGTWDSIGRRPAGEVGRGGGGGVVGAEQMRPMADIHDLTHGMPTSAPTPTPASYTGCRGRGWPSPLPPSGVLISCCPPPPTPPKQCCSALAGSPTSIHQTPPSLPPGHMHIRVPRGHAHMRTHRHCRRSAG